MFHSNILLTTATDAAFTNGSPITGSLLRDLTTSGQNLRQRCSPRGTTWPKYPLR